MDIRGWIIIAVGIAAVVEDLSSRSISNWTSGGALAAGLAIHARQAGWAGLGDAALGSLIGFAVFLVFYLLGGMGGGDVKLMAGFGALLGKGSILSAALLTALCGGLIALFYLAGRWIWSKVRKPAEGAEAAPRKASESIPYAPAIALGVWLTLLIN
jgi:prepilin peptidase CpaA